MQDSELAVWRAQLQQEREAKEAAEAKAAQSSAEATSAVSLRPPIANRHINADANTCSVLTACSSGPDLSVTLHMTA